MQNLKSLVILWMLVGCSAAPRSVVDGGEPIDAAEAIDGRSFDAAPVVDGNVADVGIEVVDAYVAPPCTLDLAGQPGELLCTGLRATSSDTLEASADVGRDDRMPLLAFERDGDVYLQVPLRVLRSCDAYTGIPEHGEAWSGALTVDVVIDGVSASLPIDVEPLVVAPTGGGNVVRVAFERLRDEYAAVSDDEAVANFESARLGVEAAQMGTVAVFNYGSPGCIPAYVCDCGPAVMTVANLAIVDAFLSNSWNGLDALDLPAGAGGGGAPTDRLARCESGTGAALRCALGFALIAIIADRPTDAFLAATGAAFYVATAFTLPAQRLVAAAVGDAKYVATQLTFLTSRATVLRHTTTRSIAFVFARGMNRAVNIGLSEDEIPCGECQTPPPSSDELAAAGCDGPYCVSWNDCGCTSGFGCRGQTLYGCGPGCLESSPGTPVCIPPTCIYRNTWQELPVNCPARCSSDMTPACR